MPDFKQYFDNVSSSGITIEEPGTIPKSTDDTNASTQNVNNETKQKDIMDPVGIPNELGRFATYNAIFSLYALTADEVNNNLYRREDPSIVCVKSGGGANISGGLDLEEFDNRLEYFIDNVTIESIIVANKVTKHSNSTKIAFDVFEPYSLGQFPLVLMKSSQIAANTDEVNYLAQPYLLIVDFVGWNTDGKLVSREYTSRLRRMIPIKINDVRFEVSERGSQYKIQAIPWNEQGSLYHNQSTSVDLKLQGHDVKDMCQTSIYSITSMMTKQDPGEDDKLRVSNEYLIVFPKVDDTGTVVREDIFENTTDYKSTQNIGGIVGEIKKPQIKEIDDARAAQYLKDSIQGDPDNPETLKKFRETLREGDANVLIRRSDKGEIARIYADKEENNNAIGKSKMVENPLDHVQHPFFLPVLTEISETSVEGVVNEDTVQFNRRIIKQTDGLMSMTFPAGTTIQEMIEEIILMSDYGRNLVSQTPDSNGFYTWYKVEHEVFTFQKDKFNRSSGQNSKLFVYNVIPYKIHKDKYQPLAASIDYSPIRNRIAKVYNYQYTGLNDSILEFNIAYNNSFFNAIAHSYDTRAGAQLQTSSSRAENPVKDTLKIAPSDTKMTSKSGYREINKVAGASTGKKGGSSGEKVSNAAARDMNDVLLNGMTDLINCEMKILGDPFFLADSGMGNYHSKKLSGAVDMTEDNTMDYESGEVHVIVNFKSPIDYGYDRTKDRTTDGYMNFNGNFASVVGFSGLYKVNTVVSEFSNGEFTQTLRMTRRNNQNNLDTNEPVSDDKSVLEPKASTKATSMYQQNQTQIRGRVGGASA